MPCHCLLQLTLLVSAIVLIQTAASAAHNDEALLHRVQMDQLGHFVMSWTPHEEDIEIQLEVATQGYVGLGFSPTGGMAGSDIVLAWVDDHQKVQLSDRYATGEMTPRVDASQDVQLISGGRNDTHTTVRFRRPWITCDKDHDNVITSDTTRVLWAYDRERPPTSSSSAPSGRLPYHDHRGARSLYLQGRPPHVDQARAEGVRHWDVLAPNVALPNTADTLYWCKLYKMPTLSKKHHYIGYTPYIASHMEPYVHHMILYECHAGSDSGTADYLDQWVRHVGAQCYAANMPDSWHSCNMPIVAWGTGSEGFFLPEHTGFPLGEEHGGASYFMLEIHYNNPTMAQNVVDNSGLRLHYTPVLRQYDAGTLSLGHTVEPFQIIPPGREWDSTGHCTADCTRLTLPASGITAFSGMMHAHLLGTAITAQHIRYGTELPTLLQDAHYDFNFQQERILPEERTILPGDHFIVTCHYDARHKRNTTYGGFKTSEEMCLVFISYYPRQELSECFSRPDIAVVLDTVGVHNMVDNNRVLNGFKLQSFDLATLNPQRELTQLQSMAGQSNAGQSFSDVRLSNYLNRMIISAPPELNGTTLLSLLNDRRLWQREAMVRTLQDRMNKGQYEPYCVLQGRGFPRGFPKKDKYPPFKPYVPPAQICKKYDILQLKETTINNNPSNTISEDERTVYHNTNVAAAYPPTRQSVGVAPDSAVDQETRGAASGSAARGAAGTTDIKDPLYQNDSPKAYQEPTSNAVDTKRRKLRLSQESSGDTAKLHSWMWPLLWFVLVSEVLI